MSIWWEKTSVNDTLPNYARTTDISVCLPLHIQALCQRQKPWKKLQDKQTNRQTDKHTDDNFGVSRFLQMTLYPVMPGLQTFLSAYLCTFRVCAKDKNLGRNFKRIRRTDIQTNWKVDQMRGLWQMSWIVYTKPHQKHQNKNYKVTNLSGKSTALPFSWGCCQGGDPVARRGTEKGGFIKDDLDIHR